MKVGGQEEPGEEGWQEAKEGGEMRGGVGEEEEEEGGVEDLFLGQPRY